jgi:uncharacterized protein (DUF2236 family)
MQDHGIFSAKSTTWNIAKEAIILVGGTRAVLMQIAHPLVAAGVYEHSSYMRDPFGRAWRTFFLGQLLVFGTTQKAREAAKTINRLHKNVHGTLSQTAGHYQSGTPYDARDPELLLWVYATLVDTTLLTSSLLIKPLTLQEKEHYYQESKNFARYLGLQDNALPPTLQGLQDYIHTMIYSNHLVVTPQATQIAHQVFFPFTNPLLRPLMYLNLNLTTALLPPPVREIYDLSWGTKRQQIFDLFSGTARLILPRLPLALRILPLTRRLMNEED